MFRVIVDLFIAGSETTSSTLDWAFLFMTEKPDVQRKCQQEIEQVLVYFFVWFYGAPTQFKSYGPETGQIIWVTLGFYKF
jgi:cytochrome P450